MGYEGLLIANTIRTRFLIEIDDNLLELLKLGVGIDEEGVDGEEVEVGFGELVVPPGQFQAFFQVVH